MPMLRVTLLKKHGSTSIIPNNRKSNTAAVLHVKYTFGIVHAFRSVVNVSMLAPIFARPRVRTHTRTTHPYRGYR